ncbi:MAG: DUF2764 family protein [Brevinematia bacterium]
MRRYYYLIASLPEVILHGETKGMPLDEFLDFCEAELHPLDFKNLKMMYIFQDIKNAVYFKSEEDFYHTPSYYSKEEFLENIKDSSDFLPFLSDYFFLRKEGKRLFPKMIEIDELTYLFYESLEELDVYPFVKRYYTDIELVLKNISSAMVMRHKNKFEEEKLIPFGEYYERIVKSSSADMGFAIEFPFIEKMNDALHKNDLVGFEEIIENARWEMLDLLVGDDFFAVTNVFAIGVKLFSVERWKKLSPEKGKERLDELLASFKARISFPPEFQRIKGSVK